MRPFLNGNHSINATTINIKRLPVSLKVLYVGDKFRINEISTEYTVITSDVTSDANGEASITIDAPGIIAAYTDLTPVQIPFPRPLTDNTRTAVSAETGNIIYFIKFDFDTIHRITDIASYDSGNKIQITSADHGLITGDSITLDLPTIYAGTYTVTRLSDDIFVVTKAFVSVATTGTFDVDSPTYLTTAPTNITWDSLTWTGIGGLLIFDSITETSDLKGNNTNFKLSGVDPTVLSLLLSKAYIGRDVTVWGGHINSDGTILCDSVKNIIMINQMIGGFDIDHEISEKDKSGTVTITASFEDNSVSSDQVIGIQTNPSSHQRFYPDDKFFDQIPKLINKQIKFGDLNISGGGGMCFFWIALTLTISSQNLKDDTLDTLRWYRDNKIEKSVGVKYKEIAPKIIKGVESYSCNIYIYRWISDYTLKLSQLIKDKKYIEAEQLYYKNLFLLERFVG